MEKVILLSVIVSTYNSELFFEGKLKDLINQTIFEQTEIIIIDSASQENEEKIAEKYLEKYSNIKYLKTEEKETIYKAWNRGIKLSKGKYITNANTDDRLKNTAYEILTSHLDENPEVALVYADQIITPSPNQTFEEAENFSAAKSYRAPDYDYFNQLDRGQVFSQPMWRSSLHFTDNIWYDENYEICGDYDFQLKISQNYQMLHIPKTLGTFYLSPNQKNKSFSNLKEVINERQKISEPYIKKYINKLDDKKLNELINNKFNKYIKYPLPLFYIWKKFQNKVHPLSIYDKYYYSIEFAFYFTILALLKIGNNKKALKLSKKFLRYSNSKRIEQIRNYIMKQLMKSI